MWQLILSGTVACLALSSSPLRADDVEDKATATIERLGGRVTRDGKLPGKPVVAVTLALTPVRAADMKELSAFKNLASLDLGRSRIADEDLKELAPLTRLSALRLDRALVTDRMLATLRQMNLLHALALTAAAGGKRPTKSEDVTSFTLTGTKVTMKGLKSLAAFKNLAMLSMSAEAKELEAGDLKELAAFEHLSVFYLRHDQVTDQVLVELRSINRLHVLDLASGPNNKGSSDKCVLCAVY